MKIYHIYINGEHKIYTDVDVHRAPEGVKEYEIESFDDIVFEGSEIRFLTQEEKELKQKKERVQFKLQSINQKIKDVENKILSKYNQSEIHSFPIKEQQANYFLNLEGISQIVQDKYYKDMDVIKLGEYISLFRIDNIDLIYYELDSEGIPLTVKNVYERCQLIKEKSMIFKEITGILAGLRRKINHLLENDKLDLILELDLTILDEFINSQDS